MKHFKFEGSFTKICALSAFFAGAGAICLGASLGLTEGGEAVNRVCRLPEKVDCPETNSSHDVDQTLWAIALIVGGGCVAGAGVAVDISRTRH